MFLIHHGCRVVLAEALPDDQAVLTTYSPFPLWVLRTFSPWRRALVNFRCPGPALLYEKPPALHIPCTTCTEHERLISARDGVLGTRFKITE